MRTLTDIRDLLTESFSEWKEDGAQQLGANLAYYTTLSISPVVVVAVGIGGWFFGREAASARFIEELNRLVGPTGAEVANTVLTNSSHSVHGFAAIVGAVGVLLGASTVFGALQSALNQVWNVETPKHASWLSVARARAISFALVLGIGFLLLVSLLLSTLAVAASHSFNTAIATPAAFAPFLETGVSLLVAAFMFGIIFKVLPDADIGWKDVWIGAGATSVMFNVGKIAIGLALGNSDAASAYGAAGSFVALLIWVYYSAQIVLFGAEFTEVYSRRFGSRRGKEKRARSALLERHASHPAAEASA